MYTHTQIYTYMPWKLKQDCLGKGRVLVGTGAGTDMVKIDDIVEQMSVNPFTMYSEYRL